MGCDILERTWYCCIGFGIWDTTALNVDFTMKMTMLIQLDYAHPTGGCCCHIGQIPSNHPRCRSTPALWIYYWCWSLCYGYLRRGWEDQMEWWQDCAWEPYSYTGRDEKFRKHETNCAAVGLAFFPFVLGCFGGIGSYVATWREISMHFGFSGT